MINTSNEYKRYIADSVDSTLSREFVAKANIALADGTILNVTDADIVKKGLKISDATSPSNSFQIGSAIINQCNIMLNNIGGKFDQYDFTDAIIRPYIGLRLSETTEWLARGVFTVDEPTVASSIISLVALDNMNKFDTEFSNVTQMFPCTALQLLQSVCLYCGVYLATSTFLNSDFMIQRRPSDEATTCREIVAWIGQISGNNARCNIDGALELKWYDFGAFESSDNLDGGRFDSATPYATGDNADGGNFIDYNSGDNFDGGTFLDMDRYHHIYALSQTKIGTDDVIITGVEVKAMGTESDYGETVLFGSKGYVIRIDKNPLITENTASIIANSIGAKIVGMKFRPMQISTLSDPSVEAGDVAYVSDKKGNSYQIIVSNVSYTIGNPMSISCDAETPSKKQSVRFDPSTKSIVEARKAAKQEISMYDLAVQQLNSVALNSMGFYPTQEIQEDDSIIDYAHDKPTLAESETVYKKTRDGFFFSKDGGATYTSGMTADGNILANVLTAIGIKAEWLIVGGTISGMRIEADTGQIGPFKLSNEGLTSKYMQFYDNGTYPLIWLTKPGTDGGGWGAESSQRANYEPAVTVLRSIVDGIETDVTVAARDDGFGHVGLMEIEKWDRSTGEVISVQRISDDGIELEEEFLNGWAQKASHYTTNSIAWTNGGQLGTIIFEEDGTIDIYCDHLKHNGIPI